MCCINMLYSAQAVSIESLPLPPVHGCAWHDMAQDREARLSLTIAMP